MDCPLPIRLTSFRSTLTVPYQVPYRPPPTPLPARRRSKFHIISTVNILFNISKIDINIFNDYMVFLSKKKKKKLCIFKYVVLLIV